MEYSKIFIELKNFTFSIDSDMIVKSVSSNIANSKIRNSIIGENIVDVFSQKILFNELEVSNEDNSNFENKVLGIINKVLGGESVCHQNLIKSFSVNNILYNYSFGLDSTLLSGFEVPMIILCITDFAKFSSSQEYYESLLDNYHNEFNLILEKNQIARFIIDFERNRYLVFANDEFSKLLNIEKTKDNYYILNSRKNLNKNAIIISESFFPKSDKLLSGEIKVLNDEWEINNRWLKLEAKVLDSGKSASKKLVGGIIYDITYFHKFKDLEHINSIYELAITSGGIGLFHYNLDKHDAKYFEANDIYANIFGLDSNKDGLYSTKDFLKAQLILEDDISDYDHVEIQLNKLYKGEVKGTTDDILKIKNLKDESIKYLLSSSKIESYNLDGSARRFGGIVIDITDRITKQKNQREYAYKDELSSLGNNRLLHKDLLERDNGIGLFFDLDNFKKINDNYGHLVGDKMIKAFGKCLLEVSNEYENVIPYRLYGDEFFVFGENKSAKFATDFDVKLNDLLDLEMKNSDHKDIVLEASMGIAFFKKGSDIYDFIKTADYSMYEVKINKKK